MTKVYRVLAFLLVVALLGGCVSSNNTRSNLKQAIDEVKSRDIRFPDYPQAGKTYLSFSHGHGFQVTYLAKNNQSFLWYPGNRDSVSAEYRQVFGAKKPLICWRYPTASFNPVTQSFGGQFKCTSLEMSQKTIVAALDGDPFGLQHGKVPHVLDRCTAPAQFTFDRERFACK